MFCEKRYSQLLSGGLISENTFQISMRHNTKKTISWYYWFYWSFWLLLLVPLVSSLIVSKDLSQLISPCNFSNSSFLALYIEFLVDTFHLTYLLQFLCTKAHFLEGKSWERSMGKKLMTDTNWSTSKENQSLAPLPYVKISFEKNFYVVIKFPFHFYFEGKDPPPLLVSILCL